MVFNTIAVGYSVTPAVVSTLFSHYLNRKPLAEKPTAHISYDEGLHLIRKFLLFASHNTVEDFQRFTAQWVPHPSWVLVDSVPIPQQYLTKSAEAINEQLGHHGVEKVGGKTWWQWRRPGGELKAEWIEMKADAAERKKAGPAGGKRVMLYVHGGAYFFGSTDEHRYQMQRHARKLKARVFAPRYRLAPQFPFPCGLYDCLAAYLYLLTIQDPTTIILAGDSAGGGMVLSMLVTLRDRGLPLPAGAVLISPWVDLTHSFPSVAGDNPLDYIPPHGFHQKPSPSWPPPNADDMLKIQEGLVSKMAHQDNLPQSTEEDAVQGFHVTDHPAPGTTNDTAATGTVTNDGSGPQANTIPGPGHNLSIMIDGKLVEIKDQIQMYATNQLMSHPLVSPVVQPSLGGLPPLLIMVGGGEMLRDEQIFIAHKAANPAKYPPGDAFLDESPFDHNRDQINKWKPTDVQLQVWDDLCHVAPTLSFTRPAKHMYRSIAQFGAWALARAQKTEIEILDDDNISIISQSDSDIEDTAATEKTNGAAENTKNQQVGKAGDALPPFKNHMIRQRVDRHGIIRPLEAAHTLPGCQMDPSLVGVIKEGPVKKWMTAKLQWDTKYASSKRKVQKKRAKEMAEGYQTFGNGEVPPPSALAGRRRKGDQDREEKKKRSYGLGMWSMWGSKHDEVTIKNEEEADRAPETATASAADGANARPLHDTEAPNEKTLGGGRPKADSRSRSRRRIVKDENQTDGASDIDENTSAAELVALQKANGERPIADDLKPSFAGPGAIDGATDAPSTRISAVLSSEAAPPGAADAAVAAVMGPSVAERSAGVPTITTTDSDAVFDDSIDTSKARPKVNGIAMPFKLKRSGEEGGLPASSASIATLTSDAGAVPPMEDVRIKGAMVSGVGDSEGIMEGKGHERHFSRNASPATDEHSGVGALGLPGSSVEKVVQNGEVKTATEAARPELNSFVTALEDLPTSRS